MRILHRDKSAKRTKEQIALQKAVDDNASDDALLEAVRNTQGMHPDLSAAFNAFKQEPSEPTITALAEEIAKDCRREQTAMRLHQMAAPILSERKWARIDATLKPALKSVMQQLRTEAKELGDSYKKQAKELGVTPESLAGPIVQKLNARISEIQKHIDRAHKWDISNTRTAIQLALTA